jgi:hypothetical protein
MKWFTIIVLRLVLGSLRVGGACKRHHASSILTSFIQTTIMHGKHGQDGVCGTARANRITLWRWLNSLPVIRCRCTDSVMPVSLWDFLYSFIYFGRAFILEVKTRISCSCSSQRLMLRQWYTRGLFLVDVDEGFSINWMRMRTDVLFPHWSSMKCFEIPVYYFINPRPFNFYFCVSGYLTLG